MITTLEKLKLRLALADATQDALLTQLIQTIGARFDNETGRTLARTVDCVQEFRPRDREISVKCYPIETVTKFETKTTEAEGWTEETGIDYVIRSTCIISLNSVLPVANAQICRVTYTGGYVMPPAVPGAGQAALPPDLEAAAIEQAAQMYQLRTSSGVYRIENTGGTYWEMGDRYWVPWVRGVLRRYRRMALSGH